MNYSNAVTDLTINDWPYGRKQVQAIFSVEQNKGKERAVRITQNPKGGWNKPKKMTYAKKILFVTGEDNKTYILELSEFGSISVMQSNFKFQQEVIYKDDARFNDLLTMFGGDV